MDFCKHCGAQIDGSCRYCPHCGAERGVSGEEAAQSSNAGEPEEKQGLHVGYLVWSIINMIVGIVPLGVVGLIFTILANNTPMERAKGYLKTVKTVNLISSIVAGVLYAIVIMIYLCLIIFAILAASAAY